MWTLLFSIMMILIFGKILLFSIRAAWGFSKVIVSLVMLPIGLMLLVVVGLIKLALPILLIVGIISLVALHD